MTERTGISFNHSSSGKSQMKVKRKIINFSFIQFPGRKLNETGN